jgi:hypothetical protein
MSKGYTSVWNNPRHPSTLEVHAAGAQPPQVLHTARDADQASMACHMVRQRLTRERVGGELLLQVHRDNEPRTLLRESFGEARSHRCGRLQPSLGTSPSLDT